MGDFSDRHGFGPEHIPIRYRNDAPHVLRDAVYSFAEQAGAKQLALAQFIVDKFPTPYPSAGIPLIARAVDALSKCQWNLVYDTAQDIWFWLREQKPDGKIAAMKYQKSLNALFWREGIGWQMEGGRINARVDDAGESAVHTALKLLKEAGLVTSAAELGKAREDISRRPAPDITGAIQHLGAAMECCMRDVCGDNATMGDLLKRYPNRFPQAIKPAVTSIWGYASEMGRHLREGREPGMAEAVFALEMTAAAINYLLATRERG